MITINRPFQEFSFARDFAFCEVNTDNYVLVQEQFATLKININQIPTGSSGIWAMQFQGKELSLFLTNYASILNTEIPNSANYAGSLEFYQLFVYLKLTQQTDFNYLQQFFQFSFDQTNGIIHITANNAADSFLMLDTMTGASNGITITDVVQVGSPLVVREDFKLIVTTTVETWLHDFNMLPAGTDDYLPDASGNVTIEVHENILPFFGRELPELGLSTGQDLNERVKRFSVLIVEYYNGIAHFDDSLLIPLEKAIEATGVHDTLINRNNRLSYYAAEVLTNKKDYNFVLSKNQFFVFSIINSETFNNTLELRIILKYYHVNGINDVSEADRGVVVNLGCIQFNFHLINNNATLNPDPLLFPLDQIAKVEIYFEKENALGTWTVISPIITLNYEEPLPNERFFMFKNNLGAYETLRAIGHTEHDYDYDFEVGEQYLQPTHNIPDGNFIKLHSNALHQLKASIGFKNLEENKYYNEFIGSSEVYEIIDNKTYPIIISSKKMKPGDSINYVSAIEFDYYYAFYKSGGQ